MRIQRATCYYNYKRIRGPTPATPRRAGNPLARRFGMTDPTPSGMTRLEIRASVSLASIFALRLLGLFLILPVFAVYAQSIPGGTDATLVGLALGIYGLTQGLLQVPYGAASDRWGRKPVIAAGLVVFAAGSFIAAAADDIGWTIVGRAIQGAGAISAAVTAFIADATRDEHRTKAMALVGASVAATFAGSLVLAPALYDAIGVKGLFAMTGVLVVAAIGVLLWVVPPAPPPVPRVDRRGWREAVIDRQLLRLNFGIFALHTVLMAMFVVVPVLLVQSGGLPLAQHWKVYLPVIVLSFALMMKPLIVAERRASDAAAVYRRDRAGTDGTTGIPISRRYAYLVIALAAALFHRLQYSGGVLAIIGVAHCARVGKRSGVGHLQYGAGVGTVCRWRIRRRHRRAMGF